MRARIVWWVVMSLLTGFPGARYCVGAEEAHGLTPDATHGQKATDHGRLTGIVIDTLCHRITNATVNVGTVGTSTETGPDGRFSVVFGFSDVSAGQALLVSTASAGYAENQTKIVLSAATEYQTVLVLKPIAARTLVIAPNSEELIAEAPYCGWVGLPPASLLSTTDTPITVPVTAQLTTLDLTTDDRMAFPGNDFLGVDPQNEANTVALEVVAVAEIKLRGVSGVRYHRLAVPATLRLAIPGALLAHFADGDSVPLWYYDTTDGLWRQDGIGTVRGEPFDKRRWLEGKVTHMTWWSFAFPMREYACVRMRPVAAETHAVLTHLSFALDGISFVSRARGMVQGNEVVFVSKRSQDAEHREQARMMLYREEAPMYLQRDATHPNVFYTTSMAGLATPIPMPTTAVTNGERWENCQDLGEVNISSRQPVGMP